MSHLPYAINEFSSIKLNVASAQQSCTPATFNVIELYPIMFTLQTDSDKVTVSHIHVFNRQR